MVQRQVEKVHLSVHLCRRDNVYVCVRARDWVPACDRDTEAAGCGRRSLAHVNSLLSNLWWGLEEHVRCTVDAAVAEVEGNLALFVGEAQLRQSLDLFLILLGGDPGQDEFIV